MKQNVDLSEDNLLSELHNIFEGYQAELPEQKANVNNLQTKTANLNVEKLPEYNLCHIMNTLLEMKLCSAMCDKSINYSKQVITPIIYFSIGNIMKTTHRKPESKASSLSSCCDISTQTDSEMPNSE